MLLGKYKRKIINIQIYLYLNSESVPNLPMHSCFGVTSITLPFLNFPICEIVPFYESSKNKMQISVQ